MRLVPRMLLVLLCTGSFAAPAHAAERSVVIDDPLDTERSALDISRLEVRYDNVAGRLAVTIKLHAAMPLQVDRLDSFDIHIGMPSQLEAGASQSSCEKFQSLAAIRVLAPDGERRPEWVVLDGSPWLRVTVSPDRTILSFDIAHQGLVQPSAKCVIAWSQSWTPQSDTFFDYLDHRLFTEDEPPPASTPQPTTSPAPAAAPQQGTGPAPTDTAPGSNASHPVVIGPPKLRGPAHGERVSFLRRDAGGRKFPIEFGFSDPATQSGIVEVSKSPVDTSGRFPANGVVARLRAGSAGGATNARWNPPAVGEYYWYVVRQYCHVIGDCFSQGRSEVRKLVIEPPPATVTLFRQRPIARKAAIDVSVACSSPPCRVALRASHVGGKPLLIMRRVVTVRRKAVTVRLTLRGKSARTLRAMSKGKAVRYVIAAESTDIYRQKASDEQKTTLEWWPYVAPKPLTPSQRAAEVAEGRAETALREYLERLYYPNPRGIRTTCTRARGHLSCTWQLQHLATGETCMDDGEARVYLHKAYETVVLTKQDRGVCF